jgi:hypothetical protein
MYPPPPAEQQNKRDEATPWDKCWIFSLAGVVLISLLALGTWGRVRMLKDDNKALQQQLDNEELAHEQMESQLKKKLAHKTELFNHLAREMSVAVQQFQMLNRTMKETKKNVKGAIDMVEDNLLTECAGVDLPAGFEFSPKGQPIFPHDLLGNTTALHQLLESEEKFSDLLEVTAIVERSHLFTQPTYPWLQWTWLQALRDRPELEGNFTEWGLARGGSSFFVAGLAKQHNGSLAGFDFWPNSVRADPPPTLVLAQLAQTCGVSAQDAKFYNLADPTISWPENGKKERLAFTHVDSDDYNTTLGILQVVYNNTVSGGLFTIDNFFHPSGGSKRAVEDFFKVRTPGKSPLLFPVFPGFSVVIFKDRFANATDGDQQNSLDGNFYSFELIKGYPEIVQAVQQSIVTLSDVHRHAKNDPSVNQTARCWLAHALGTAQTLHDFVASTSHSASDYELADMFRFMAGSSPLTRKVA